MRYLDSVLVVAGLVIASYGAYLAWPPLGFLLFGAGLMRLGWPD